jgi:hypothetical protein
MGYASDIMVLNKLKIHVRLVLEHAKKTDRAVSRK